MTAIAIHIYMLALQAEIRVVMIKFLFAPTALIVTIRTVITELFFVNVILPVTINTAPRCVTVFLSMSMASVTADSGMRSLQRIIRIVMIKCFYSQPDNICITSLMIRVAMFACGPPCHTPPVVTPFRTYVIPDFFMTVRTQAVLTFLAEWLMAVTAVFFVFGMPLHKRSRHNQ